MANVDMKGKLCDEVAAGKVNMTPPQIKLPNWLTVSLVLKKFKVLFSVENHRHAIICHKLHKILRS